MVAAIKAVAVWPDGNELFLRWLGRSRLTVYFNPLTTPAIKAAEITSAVIISPQVLLPLTPASFIPNMAAIGAYCR